MPLLKANWQIYFNWFYLVHLKITWFCLFYWIFLDFNTTYFKNSWILFGAWPLGFDLGLLLVAIFVSQRRRKTLCSKTTESVIYQMATRPVPRTNKPGWLDSHNDFSRKATYSQSRQIFKGDSIVKDLSSSQKNLAKILRTLPNTKR